MENCPPFRVINLAHRTDRWKDVTENLRSLSVPYQRVDAVRNKNGALGCARSHVKALLEGLEDNADLVAIAEDDAVFQEQPFAIIDKFRASDADVLLLGYNIGSTQPEAFSDDFGRIKASLTTSCYIVKKHALQRLKDCFKGAEDDMIKGIHRPIDIAWQRLQKELTFVVPKAGHRVLQRAGFSDIENRRVNYRV